MTAGSTQRPERLTRDNALLLLVDHQVGLYTGIRDIDVLQLKRLRNSVARCARHAPRDVVAVWRCATVPSQRSNRTRSTWWQGSIGFQSAKLGPATNS